MASLSRNNSAAALSAPSSGTPRARTAGETAPLRPARPTAPAQLLASLGLNSAQSTPTGLTNGRAGPFGATDEHGRRAGSPTRADTSISLIASPVLGETELRSLQKQWDSQERLLAGFQRYVGGLDAKLTLSQRERALRCGDRAATQAARLVDDALADRRRQREQEAFLFRLYGPDWEDEIARSAGTPPVVSRTLPSAPMAPSSSSTLLGVDGASASPSPAAALPPGLDASTLLRHIDGVHSLVDSLQRQLKLRETELDALLASHEIADGGD